jgi:hypothetical protein
MDVVEIALFLVGLPLGLFWFSVVILPLFYGLPRSLYWALGGRVKWYSPTRYLVSPILWTLIFFGAALLLVLFLPQVAALLQRSDGFATGQLLGILIGAARALFSRSSWRDLNEDFLGFMGPYLTAKGIAAAGMAEWPDDGSIPSQAAAIEQQIESHGQVGHQRLEILMDFDLQLGIGLAATRWQTLRSHPQLTESLARIALVALLYGRTLVNHAETRSELYERVQRAAQGLFEGDPSPQFDEWKLEAGGLSFQIWPWSIVSPEQLSKSKAYTATLLPLQGGTLGIYLDMAGGLERVLAPSAPVISIFRLSDELEAHERQKLGATLLAMNSFYGRPERSKKIGSELRALQAALPTLLP